jgi:hypothetical protein
VSVGGEGGAGEEGMGEVIRPSPSSALSEMTETGASLWVCGRGHKDVRERGGGRVVQTRKQEKTCEDIVVRGQARPNVVPCTLPGDWCGCPV